MSLLYIVSLKPPSLYLVLASEMFKNPIYKNSFTALKNPLIRDHISQLLNDPTEEQLDNYFVTILASMHELFIHYLEAVKKSDWMTNIGNINDAMAVPPVTFNIASGMFTYYFANEDPQIMPNNIPNFTVSQHQTRIT